LGEASSRSKEHLAFLCAEKVAKSSKKVTVCRALALLNLEPLSLIRPMPHAFGFVRYPVCGAGFAAISLPEFDQPRLPREYFLGKLSVVSLHNLDPTLGCVPRDCIRLIVSRVTLMLGRHGSVLCSAPRARGTIAIGITVVVVVPAQVSSRSIR